MEHRPEIILLRAMALLNKAQESIEAGMTATATAHVRDAHELIGSITLADLNTN